YTARAYLRQRGTDFNYLADNPGCFWSRRRSERSHQRMDSISARRSTRRISQVNPVVALFARVSRSGYDTLTVNGLLGNDSDYPCRAVHCELVRILCGIATTLWTNGKHPRFPQKCTVDDPAAYR